MLNANLRQCATCRRELKEGEGILRLEEGLLGRMGFVALEAEKLFCDSQCLKGHFNGARGHATAPRRIP